MLGQSVRSHKHSVGLNASASTVNSSEFHTVRLQEMERGRAIKDLGAREDRGQVAPSYFVPSLQSICADILAQNFSTTPEIDALQREQPALYELIVERLPVAVLPQEEEETAAAAAATAAGAAGSSAFLPLNVAVPRVVSEAYWKRCCLSRWSAGQLSRFTGGGKPLQEKQYGWKRLFLEHVLNNFLLSLRSGSSRGAGQDAGEAAKSVARTMARVVAGHPQGRTRAIGAPPTFFSSSISAGGDADADADAATSAGPSQLTDADARALAELCAVCRDYVHTVELPCQYTHLQWHEHLFSRLPGILSFRLTHGTSSAGIGYDRTMLGFTDDDAKSIRHLLCRYTSLEALRLPQNSITGPQTLMIASGLVGNTRLRVLDLARNAVSDAAITEGLALLLCQPEFPLEELNLNDNNITGVGAAALADALAVNRTLVVLNLGQNRIADADGGAAIFRAIGQNAQSPLRELNLGGNLLAGHTVAALRDVLPGQHTLTALNLAGNRRIGGTASSGRGGGGVGAGETANEAATVVVGGAVGDVLCEAVQANTSLHFIDVRFCNLSTEQVCTIEAAVQGRVERDAAEQRRAKEEEQRIRIADMVASRPSWRC